MASVENDRDFKRAIDEAAVAFICYAARPKANSKKILRERLTAVLRLCDGFTGEYFKVQELREVLNAVVERSVAIFADEMTAGRPTRISPDLAEAVQQDFARMLRKVCAVIEVSMPTAH